MKISFITLFPELIQTYLSAGLISRAEKNQIFDFEILNLREQAQGNYKSVDDTVYGGSDGLLLQYEPLKKALSLVSRKSKSRVIYLSPQGKKLSPALLSELKSYEHLILISGRYAGVDQRFIASYVDEEISIGDYVLSGGELPSLVLVEALSRKIEGVLGNEQSAQQDSFEDDLLEAPQFTKPNEVDTMKVPAVLTSGDHKKIQEWKKNMSVLVTLKKRKDLLTLQKQDWKKVLNFYQQLSEADKEMMQIQNLEEEIKQL